MVKQASQKKYHRQASCLCYRAPAEEAGLYWGYTTRLAKGFGAIFSETPYEVLNCKSLVT